MLWSADVLFWGQKTSCSMDVLYGGLGKSKLQFLIKRICNKNFPAVKFFLIFGHKNPGSGGIGIQPKTLDPEPESINPVRNQDHNQ